MSEHMRTHHTKVSKEILCISEQGNVLKLPMSILNKYEVHDKASYKRAKNLVLDTFSVTPAEAFAEINAKYTKSGALLKAIRLRESLTQKEFAHLIKVTQGDLSKMELGKRPIGKMLANRIAKKFGSRIS
jgi:DNA-binding transcriptional regulator YiaG